MRRIWILLLSSCLFLSGCGAGEDEAAVHSAEVITGQGMQEVVQSESMLSVKAIQTIRFEEPEEGYATHNIVYRTVGNELYQLRVEVQNETGNQRLCMQIYDGETQKVQRHMLTPELPEHGEYRIYSVDLRLGRELSFKMREEGEESTCFLVRTDLKGTVVEVIAPFPDEESYPWNAEQWTNTGVFNLADGRTIVRDWSEDTQSSVLTWLEEDGAKKALGTLEGENVTAVCCDEDGILYYAAGDSVVRWDLEKNAREELFRMHENGIEPGGTIALMKNSQGDILLCRMNQGNALVYVLTDEEIVSEEEIRIACVLNPIGIDYIQKRAAVFSRESGDIPVVLETEREQYQEDYRTRIMAELAAGKGPEMMWLSREDMQLLAGKGLLCDLTDMIPEEVRAELIPGVAELGKVDGQLVGFTPEVKFVTMMAANRTWEKDGWNLAEFTALAANENGWECLVNNWDNYSLLYGMFLKNLANSPMLDLEQGISHFDSEEFVQILQLCKKYGQENSVLWDREESIRMLKEGKSAAEYVFIYDLGHFSDIMAMYGEDCHIVGYPAEEGSGSYVDTYSVGYLAVNAKAEHKEKIAEFIACLLDYANQYEVNGCSVRMDVLRDSVIYRKFWDGSGKYVQSMSANSETPVIRELTLKSDGTTYLEEFIDFLETCRPVPDRLPYIFEILDDELPAYFTGSKSAEETADIIHRRVQLYLDEMR